MKPPPGFVHATPPDKIIPTCFVCDSEKVVVKEAFFDPCGGQDDFFECEDCGATWFSDINKPKPVA